MAFAETRDPARSGAYNRTLWEAPDTYMKMSPFMRLVFLPKEAHSYQAREMID
jgi:hypothetical protein